MKVETLGLRNVGRSLLDKTDFYSPEIIDENVKTRNSCHLQPQNMSNHHK